MNRSADQEPSGRLTAGPVSREVAAQFIRTHHRHHRPSVGDKFRVGAFAGQVLVGVAVAGRPVARRMDDGYTVEVIRCCTQGYRNAASFLYGRILKAATALGFRRAITYTLDSEAGASLRGAGFLEVALTRGGSWDRPSRARTDAAPIVPKKRWQAELGDQFLPASAGVA